MLYLIMKKIQATIFDVEQTVQVFSGVARTRKSQYKIKWGVNRGHQGDNVKIA